ncbi:hypothetical protein HBI56_169330 [Parastagonospora nodorum]|nr:hypothetical protein HBH53_184750 [Parastagonospora nodorum]KAH3997589.1 hypothetical protein HBI10_143970 [Parastagonospora nodorum]KAH4021153.1 hypothetical protein HBI13_112270 [Parastagonospora nodorum]KAH4037063.1 hypothetical protein HBI09_065400 [Parastagonospora nodorum]KAH4107790.1 hypothetical protein HBH46_054990 [Parastagonospora nodorum]
MAIENAQDDYEKEFFFTTCRHQVWDLTKLEGCDILVDHSLILSAHFVGNVHWRACPKSNVHVVDTETGEWIDSNTAGPIIDDWDKESEEDFKQREEAMMKMKEPLPRIELNY